MRKFKPTSIFDLALVTAAIRPSGASYRDELLIRKPHKNPSPIIDELLEDSLGYLCFQESIIAFLQQICGLSGSTSDSIRRGIARKRRELLDDAMPLILDGYCSKSSQPREVAEQEAKEFLQIIEDSSSYMFGKNHSIAYCMLTYLCAYYRYYHPLEFITAFLNDAANDDDIKNGTDYAMKVGIMVTNPKYGFSRSEYFYDKEHNIIAKGLESVKFMNNSVADDLYRIAHEIKPTSFIGVLKAIDDTPINSRQLDILIKLDFFSEFGNQRELSYITDFYINLFKKGKAKQIQKEKVDGTPLEEIVKRHSNGKTKSGQESKSYMLQDIDAILVEAEKSILDLHMEDYDTVIRARNFAETMGYAGYITGKEEDRSKLYIQDVYPLRRKKDGKQFGYGVKTKSIGSGIESVFTLDTRLFKETPIDKGDVIWCTGYERINGYFHLYNYSKYPW